MQIKGNIVDIVNKRIFSGVITIEDGKITKVEKKGGEIENDKYILPGLIDSHVHIESSMLTPSRFAEVVVPHGTVAVVSDPHEIANVLGMDGIDYMRKDAKQTSLKVFFTAPSCVPATPFETAGANLDANAIEELLKQDDVVALGEMMDFPSVINNDKDVMKKIEIAKSYGKPVDGHCPALTGNALKKYVAAGISTEHECTTLKEAREKAKLGMKIMIREGSSAKNMLSLISLAKEGYECFLVSDDKHPEDLVKGHINLMLRKAVSLGLDTIKAIRMVTINPVKHYNIPVGLLQENDSADFIVVNDLKDFKVLQTWIDGENVAENGKALFSVDSIRGGNTIKLKEKEPRDFVIRAKNSTKVNVIKAIEGQIITKRGEAELRVDNGKFICDLHNDTLKIAVVERYGHNRLSIAFVSEFGLKKGAIASSIAHDSHNIIVIGTNDDEMALAVNTIKKIGGGIVAVADNKIEKLELPIAGLMSTESVKTVNERLSAVHKTVKNMGCKLSSPFTTMSFMALPVIPELKITDKGLFDVGKFQFIDLFVK